MYITSAEEYAVAKALSWHPNLFPDEKKGIKNYEVPLPMLICPQCQYKSIIGYEAAKDHVATHFPGMFIRHRKKTIVQLGYGSFQPVIGVRNLRQNKESGKKPPFQSIFRCCCMSLSIENPPVPAPLPKDYDDHDGGKIELLSKKTKRK